MKEYSREKFIHALNEIWNYMHLYQTIEKCDLMIGCGSSNLLIPEKCVQLYNEGYAPKILFCGGKGKITANYFTETEAEKYKQVALKLGVPEEDILTENQSSNTRENFLFGIDILKQKQISFQKVLIVHGPFSERRTFSVAKAILKESKCFITSPELTFEEFLNYLKNNIEIAFDLISVIVGDIQRLVIYPQFGWQIENEVPDEIIKAYQYLKSLGFTKYIFTRNQIQKLINQNDIIDGQIKNYFC